VTEGSKISSPPNPEPLVPDRVEIRLPPVRVSRWVIIALALFVAWFAVGIVAIRYPALDFFVRHRLTSSTNLLPYQILGMLGETVAYAVPALAGIGLIWAAFIRPQWSERALFSAALIISAVFFVAGASQSIFSHFFHHSYGNDGAMIGTVTYWPWFLMARARVKPVLAACCVTALAMCFVFPVTVKYIDSYAGFGATFPDVLGSALLGGAVVAAGMVVAEKVGAQVFGRADDAA